MFKISNFAMSNSATTLLSEKSGLKMTVLPSSVCDGFGVYSLKKIPSKTIIGKYPGVHLEGEGYDDCFDYVDDWAEKTNTDIKKDQRRRKKLKKYFGIEIVNCHPTQKRFLPPQKYKNKVADWASISKEIERYSFMTKTGTLVPKTISSEGEVILDPDHHVCGDYGSLTPYFNEAPNYHFVNLLNGKTQKNEYKIDASVRSDYVVFETCREINPGEEMFIFYGPIYKRNYKANIHPDDCNFDDNMVDDDDSWAESSSYKKFFREQSEYMCDDTPGVSISRKNQMDDEIASIVDGYDRGIIKKINRHPMHNF